MDGWLNYWVPYEINGPSLGCLVNRCSMGWRDGPCVSDRNASFTYGCWSAERLWWKIGCEELKSICQRSLVSGKIFSSSPAHTTFNWGKNPSRIFFFSTVIWKMCANEMNLYDFWTDCKVEQNSEELAPFFNSWDRIWNELAMPNRLINWNLNRKRKSEVMYYTHYEICKTKSFYQSVISSIHPSLSPSNNYFKTLNQN